MRRLAAGICAIVLFAGVRMPLSAHKPITSPYTFTADVRPIVTARCGACHAPGAVAPMSLLTQTDAVPWGESMRVELMAGHMPPWGVDRTPSRFLNAGGISARELNVLLTWASGGTPAGDLVTADATARRPVHAWPLGTPDAVLPLPAVELRGDESERVVESVVATGFTEPRWLRAADLLPGTAAIVRSAVLSVRGGAAAAGTERTLSLWVPGDPPIAAPARTGFLLPAGAEIVARVRYRKTWQYERMPMSDRSSIGLYFAPAGGARIRTVTASTRSAARLDRAAHALAIYVDDAGVERRVTVTATTPGGVQEDLLTFRPRPGWARRYWYARPIALPAGTTISVRSTPSPASVTVNLMD